MVAGPVMVDFGIELNNVYYPTLVITCSYVCSYICTHTVI